MSANRNIEDLYPRAPRYTIDFGDNQIVRFAAVPKGSRPMHTRIVNLSESGMAFIVPFLSAPNDGEKIKLEFTAPNSEPIACFAKVVRVQTHKTYSHDQKPQVFKLIAVDYEQLHPKQRQMLSLGITEQFRKKQAEFKREQFFLKLKWLFFSSSRKLKNVASGLIKK